MDVVTEMGDFSQKLEHQSESSVRIISQNHQSESSVRSRDISQKSGHWRMNWNWWEGLDPCDKGAYAWAGNHVG